MEPVVSAYALFATDFNNVAFAMDFIYEKQFDAGTNMPKFQHKFVGCLPNTPEHNRPNVNISYLN